MTVKPSPAPCVEVLKSGSGEKIAFKLFQLFAAQTLPAGSMTTSVNFCMLPYLNTWMTSPVLVPAGYPLGSAPAIKAMSSPQKLAYQTSSLPSTDTPQGTLISLPLKPFGAGWVPSGRIMFIAPVKGTVVVSSLNMCSPRSLNCVLMGMFGGRASGGKSRDIMLETQRLPFESRAMPRTEIPTLKDSALEGSSAGNRTTSFDWALLTQTRFWSSTATPKADLRPGTLTMRPSFIRPPGK